MKVIAFILAAMLLVLSCLPCADKAAGSHPETEHAARTHDHEKDHNHEHKDFCSPFCICACCSITTTHNSHVVIAISSPEIRKEFHAHYFASLFTVSIPVWQPPQLAA